MRAVITSAGKGLRMRPYTDTIPKALMPLFRMEDGKHATAPVVTMIIDALSSVDVSEFCIVVGQAGEMLRGYFCDRKISFASQKEPIGFGDAVLKGEAFAGTQPFFVHADDGVLTGGYTEAAALFQQKGADGVLMLRKVENPKRYGVATGIQEEPFLGHSVLRVTEVEEKPQQPKSNFGLSAVYVFSPHIFGALRRAPTDTGEFELTSGIEQMIREGGKVYGLILENEKWLNVGDPDSYFKALTLTYNGERPPSNGKTKI